MNERRQPVAPWLLLIAGMMLGAALLAAGFALGKLFT
jgi:hypothetical protein